MHFQKQRYYQMESKLVPSDTLLDEGVNIANVHQGNPYNPWIIYPLDPVANIAAKAFSQRMHKGGAKVKSYYSSGSLSFITPELWAFFSMYGELMSHPAYVDPIPPPTPPPMTAEQEWQAAVAAPVFISHHWFLEHAGTALFSSDWTTPLATPSHSPVCEGCDMDVSFTTRANSRLANFWARLLVLATEELDIDGIYLDGVAYDSHTMLRAMRAVSEGRGMGGESGGMMDLHCGNRWPSGGGEIDVLEYAQHMSLMDSVMFGEGFDDGGTTACKDRQSGTCGDATWMLLATSGMQFGLFNDMLTDVNLFRGMVFAMWGRPPYSNGAQNKQLWEWIDSSGLADNSTEMLGFWADQEDWHAVVTSSVADVKATAYLVQPTKGAPGQVIIAVASWVQGGTATFSLTLDLEAIVSKVQGWEALDSSELMVETPAISTVQNASTLGKGLVGLSLAPRAGMLLAVRPKRTGAQRTRQY